MNRRLLAYFTGLLVLSGVACTQETSGETANASTDAGELSDSERDGDGGVAEPEPWECAPELELDATRYGELEDLDGEPLIGELHDRIDDHDDRGYDDAREYMFEHMEVRDDGKLECIYTDNRQEPDGTTTPGDAFNTEHVWPQSRGAGEEPARSDIHHLFPADENANASRAHYEFGNVSCEESTCDWHEAGSSLGPSADDDRDPVFEVRPGRRGDVARATFYFAVRYELDVSPEEEAVLRDWNCTDPPDEYERERNDSVAEFQNNRNPFIDRPDFIDRIENF